MHKSVSISMEVEDPSSSSVFPPYLQHQTINLDVNVLFWLLGVIQLVDFHELLQALPEVEGKKVYPHQAARIQYKLQGIQLGIEVRARDWSHRRAQKKQK